MNSEQGTVNYLLGTVNYLLITDGYLFMFNIFSSQKKMEHKLRKSIENDTTNGWFYGLSKTMDYVTFINRIIEEIV